MSLNFCDLLVLGSDLSGVMAATLLAKRGMNVLVLDDDHDDPCPHLATGIGSRSFKSLLGKLMIPDSKLQNLTENKIAAQVIFPKHRLDLSKSRAHFFKEIDREFPADRPTLEALFQAVDEARTQCLDDLLTFLPVVGAKEKKAFTRWVEAFPRERILDPWNRLSPGVKSLLLAQIRFLSRAPLSDSPLLSLLLLLPTEIMASFSLKGGVRELKKIFFDKLDYFGGLVHPLGDEPFEVITKRNEIKAVQLPRYNFPTRCRFLLGNLDIRKIYKDLPNPFLAFLTDRTKNKVSDLEPVETRFCVQYGFWQKDLPAPMKENVLLIQDPAAPLIGANYLEINIHPTPKPMEHGDLLMTVTYILPGSSSEEAPTNPADHEKIHADIEGQLKRLLTFSTPHRLFPPCLEPTGISGESGELFPNHGQTDVAMTLSRMAERQTSYTPSLFFPSIESPYKNLFTLGPNVLPALGLEGKILSALRAVELIWAGELKVRNQTGS
jgi:hypothetical protein